MSAKVVLDIHEPVEIQEALESHPDVEGLQLAALEAADIVVDGVGIERKTPADFASSLVEGRLKEQAAKLTDVYDHAYVLIEGGFIDFEEMEHTQLNPKSMTGMAASLTARHGLPVIPTGWSQEDPYGHESLADYAVRLGRKHNEEPVSDYLSTGDVGMDEPAGKRMWGCLPHVGPELAGRLYEEFGTPAEFGEMWATTQRGTRGALTEVEGIGDETSKDIAKALWNYP